MRILMHILVLISACGGHNKSQPTTSPLADVLAKRDRYMDLARAQANSYGWLPPKCDGLLFNSLAAFSGFGVNPLKAEKEPGLWQREPSFSCYPNGSKSSISRDMFHGLWIYLVSIGDVEDLIEIKKYCDDHPYAHGLGCKIGEAVDETTLVSRAVMPPSMIYQLDRAINKVPKRRDEQTGLSLKSGFEGHLEVLNILTDYLIDGSLTDSDVKLLVGYADQNPRNALYQILAHKFTDGDQSKAVAVLMDESLFNSFRLPNDRDHYTHYLWQRDDGPDWEPCIETDDQNEPRRCEGLVHSGIDFMFAAKLLEL
jgi:hypothetical protein